MSIFWKVRMKFLFHMKVNKPSAIISKRVFDLHILNQWNGRIKVPVFFLWAFDTIEFERFRGWENRGSNQKWELSLSLHRRSDFAKCRVR